MSENKNNIFAIRRDLYKRTRLESWILGLTSGLLITAVLCIGIAVPGLQLILFPVICLPIIFSASLSHLFLHKDLEITAKSSVKYAFLYFRGDFVSSFRYWFSLLKGITVFMVSEFVLSFIVSSIMTALNLPLEQAIEDLYALIDSFNVDIEQINAVIYSNGAVLFYYFVSAIIPSLFLGIIFFIYNISRESLSIYLKGKMANTPPKVIQMVMMFAKRGHRMEMVKDYLGLTWPLYVLIAVGLVGGFTLSKIFLTDNILLLIVYAMIFAAFLATFYLPIYFPSMEAMLEKYGKLHDESLTQVMDMFMRNVQANFEYTKAEKERIEKAINEGKNPLSDDTTKDDEKEK